LVPINVAAFWLSLRLVHLGLGDLWRALRSTTVLTALLAGGVTLLRLALERAHVPPGLVLGLCIPFGALVYIAGARLLRPEALNDLHRVLPAALRQRPLVAWLFVAVDRAV
jgi:hypothetical protein